MSIKNFAIIDDLSIRFSGGFTILSGETGAGKSIIINAVNLLLGSRATAKLVRTGAEEAELEAFFAVDPEGRTGRIMAGHGYDPAEGLLIRRLISAGDRHRVYINGRLATMQIVGAITENLASISGQHAHQNLLREDQHLLALDQFGGLLELRQEVQACHQAILPLIRTLADLKRSEARQAEQLELLEFQKQEIAAAFPQLGEDTALEQELARMKHAEQLISVVQESIQELYDADGALFERLTAVGKQLEKAAGIDPQLAESSQAAMDSAFGIEDLAQNLRAYLETVSLDEGRLHEAEERLASLRKLKRKYGGSLEAVLAHLEKVEDELSRTGNLGKHILDTEKELAAVHEKFGRLASLLSARRQETAGVLAARVEEELKSLKMPHTRFQVSVFQTPATSQTDPRLTLDGKVLGETGLDRAVFQIAPNVGEELRPLAGIASGGELSRVVLALKAILAATEAVGTIIFDEVDAGIGGDVAELVGEKLALLSRYHQVICITHLPQIARFGEHHFRIYKQVEGGRTRTLLTSLTGEERLNEIARMLGGVSITRRTLEHAAEMLGPK